MLCRVSPPIRSFHASRPSADLNKVILVGRIGTEPQFIKFNPSGLVEPESPNLNAAEKPSDTPPHRQRGLWRFRLATNKSVKDGDGWQKMTDWHNVKVFTRDESLWNPRLVKGATVTVEGRLGYYLTDFQKKIETPARLCEVIAERVNWLSDPKMKMDEEL
ncbi:hypothetical protein SeLEV6574_g07832 [Synchytrium endobioticum]|nr:hypothetical protein SeLEV6574_g07832 [Synchytrium endobioticum]